MFDSAQKEKCFTPRIATLDERVGRQFTAFWSFRMVIRTTLVAVAVAATAAQTQGMSWLAASRIDPPIHGTLT